MKRPILLFFAILLFNYACKESNTSNDKIESDIFITEKVKKRIDSTLKSFVDEGKVAGISTLIYEKGKEVLYTQHGYADREDSLPMNRNTIVRIYSMTKPIVGTALMTLYDKGAFKLDDPLEKYAPEFANMQVYAGYDSINKKVLLEPLKRPITIRDLTRYTAGFEGPMPGVPRLRGKDNPTDKENTLQEMAEKMSKQPLAFQPGTRWAYGVSVDVQAFLIERISGIPFEQYLRENVLDPLGMDETRYYIPEEDRDRFAATYNYNRETKELTRAPDTLTQILNYYKWPLNRGALGLTSTLDDYQKFAQMLINGGTLNGVTILKPETVKLMRTNQLDDSITERMWLPDRGQMGFGINFGVRVAPPIDENENNGVVGEFFWDGAFSTLFIGDPVNDMTVVMFVQLSPYDQIKLHNTFRDAIYGNYVPEPK
ncbi:beta-lactamase family protein [Flavobacteriaceae bacterium XHP0103]|uniref:serine hydrolase domain-containing protein n=1 Tax=Marixanthotalea marina TaxID=2844359 RepID=UPI002989BB56|nr:serine hydrolase domain-containing protein [Marixanthotalea marina]MBU3821630.1 beta-lactamase family protein [Marixanthotalea marina]